MCVYIYIYIYILSITLSVLDLGAVQIEHSTWQHRIALQLCVAHCLCSLSGLRCGVEKSLRTTNETVFPAHINLSVGSACQNALCSANDATQAETAAVRRLSIYINKTDLNMRTNCILGKKMVNFSTHCTNLFFPCVILNGKNVSYLALHEQVEPLYNKLKQFAKFVIFIS